MGTRDPRVDAYIAKSADFARPVLKHLRTVIHAAAPEVAETIKWGFPHFEQQGLLCSMAAFRAHCAFGFWKDTAVLDGLAKVDREAMGQFGRIASIKDLPPRRTLVALVRKAVALNQAGTQRAGPAPRVRAVVPPLPAAFARALKRDRKASAVFAAFPPSHRREYVQWIAEAKRDETRERRIATALQWIAAGKSRHWKYQTKGGATRGKGTE